MDEEQAGGGLTHPLKGNRFVTYLIASVERVLKVEESVVKVEG